MILQELIQTKLQAGLTPSHLEVTNESHMHAVPKGSETHFKVVIVTDRFDGLSAVKRHQLVYGVLGEMMNARAKPRIHALAITSRTPAEWAAAPEANQSPLCASKK